MGDRFFFFQNSWNSIVVLFPRYRSRFFWPTKPAIQTTQNQCKSRIPKRPKKQQQGVVLLLTCNQRLMENVPEPPKPIKNNEGPIGSWNNRDGSVQFRLTWLKCLQSKPIEQGIPVTLPGKTGSHTSEVLMQLFKSKWQIQDHRARP